MADTKISAMVAASDLASAVFPIVQGGLNKQVNVNLLAVGNAPNGVVFTGTNILTSDAVNFSYNPTTHVLNVTGDITLGGVSVSALGWKLSGQSLLTNSARITGPIRTAGANNDYVTTFDSSVLTGRAGQAADTLNGYIFAPQLTTGTNGQTLNGMLINPTFVGTGTFNVLLIQNAGAAVAKFTSNGSLIVGSQSPFGFIWDGRAGNIYAGGLLALGTAPLAGPFSGYGCDIYSLGGYGIPLRILSNSGNIQLMTFYDALANLSHNHLFLDYAGSATNAGLATTTASQVGSTNLSFRSSLWNGSSETKGYFTWRAEASTTTNLDQDLVLYSSTGTTPAFTLPVLKINKGGSVMSFGYGSAELLTTSFTGGVGQNFHITNGGGGFAYRFYDNATYAGVKAGTLGTLMLTVTSSMLTVPVAARIGTYIEIAPGGANRINLFAGGGGVGLDIYNNGNANYLFQFNDLAGGALYGNQSKFPLSMYQNGADATTTGSQKNSRDFNFVSSLWTGAAETKGWASLRLNADPSTNLAQSLNLYFSTGTSPSFAGTISHTFDTSGLTINSVSTTTQILMLKNGSAATILNVRGDGQLVLNTGAAGGFTAFFKTSNTSANASPTSSVTGDFLAYYSTSNTAAGISHQFSKDLLSLTGAGTSGVMSIFVNFAVSSGTHNVTSLTISPVYNTTSTYAGTAIGIDYNPTLTSTTGLTHIAFRAVSGKVLMGATTLTASVSSLLELQSTTAALLISRMTTTQKNALTLTNGDGLVVYDTTLSKWQFRENGSWVALGGSAAGFQTCDVTIANAACLTLNSSPVTLVAAPGAGKYVYIIGNPLCKFIAGSAGFATNTTLAVMQGTFQWANQANGVSGISSTTSSYFFFPNPAASTGPAATAVENAAITLTMLTGNPTSGTGASLHITFQYIIVTL